MTIESNQTSFFLNRIIMEIRGTSQLNLSFVDLPGIISQSDKGPDIFQLMRELTHSYIREEKTLVLLVISMENDIMNSAASELVNEKHADNRCIGALTKPDRIARGDDVDQWVDTLAGRKFQRYLGYHIVKLPSQTEIGIITYAETRSSEEAYFNSNK
jgi:hypothetical protein